MHTLQEARKKSATHHQEKTIATHGEQQERHGKCVAALRSERTCVQTTHMCTNAAAALAAGAGAEAAVAVADCLQAGVRRPLDTPLTGLCFTSHVLLVELLSLVAVQAVVEHPSDSEEEQGSLRGVSQRPVQARAACHDTGQELTGTCSVAAFNGFVRLTRAGDCRNPVHHNTLVLESDPKTADGRTHRRWRTHRLAQLFLEISAALPGSLSLTLQHCGASRSCISTY